MVIDLNNKLADKVAQMFRLMCYSNYVMQVIDFRLL